jgi:hypothetical protein
MAEEEAAGVAPTQCSHPREKEKKWGIRVRVGGILVFYMKW